MPDPGTPEYDDWGRRFDEARHAAQTRALWDEGARMRRSRLQVLKGGAECPPDADPAR